MDDADREQRLNLIVYGLKPGSDSALARLNRLYNDFVDSGTAERRTSVFLVPGSRSAEPPTD